MGQRVFVVRLAVAIVLAGSACGLAAPASASAELVAGPPAGQSAGQSAGPQAGLRAAVIAKILERSGPGVAGTEVNVMREQPDWAFGAGIARSTRAEHPDGWLFVAHLDGDRWVVAFEGEPGFPTLAAAAPDGVVGDHEKQVFASAGVQANGDYRTGMRLPYAIGQSWRLTGGPHSTVRGSIDLAGGDGRVLAARAGTLYVMCSNRRGWLRIMHDRGYATDYYHLHNNRTDNGASVGAGAFLGNIGVDVSCGGSATGPHVHFSLRQNGSFVPIAGHDFGKWQPYNGASDYQGYALHGSTRVNVGSSLYNYGPLGFSQGIVDTNGGTVLNKRTGPGTGYSVAGTVADGATVSISCSANGTTHTGRSGNPTNLWNKLTDGTWVSDAYVWTGTTNPVSGWC